MLNEQTDDVVTYTYRGNTRTRKAQPPSILKSAGYRPDAVLDAVIEKMGLKNDAALARILEVAPPVVSKIRHHRVAIGAAMLIYLHEASGMSIKELKTLAGMA
jgi:plasmid maintenance system antidote protein VapI